MAKYIVTETFDADGKTCGWALIVLPDDYKEGDPLPAPQKGDRYFFDEKEALAELHLRLYGRP
jgi:hypothetical protein